MNMKNKFLEVVKSYHEVYKNYNEAYNNMGDKRESLLGKLKPLLKKGGDEEALKEASREYLSLISAYPMEVSFAATKFLNIADNYIIVTEEDLPEDIARDYVILKTSEYKSAFSVKKGDFVRNSSVELPKIPEEEYKKIFDFIAIELGVS